MNGGPTTRSHSNSSSSETSSTDHTVDPIVEDVGVDRQADDLVDDVDNADLLANLVNFEGFDDLDLRDPWECLDVLLLLLEQGWVRKMIKIWLKVIGWNLTGSKKR